MDECTSWKFLLRPGGSAICRLRASVFASIEWASLFWQFLFFHNVTMLPPVRTSTDKRNRGWLCVLLRFNAYLYAHLEHEHPRSARRVLIRFLGTALPDAVCFCVCVCGKSGAGLRSLLAAVLSSINNIRTLLQ